MDRLPNQRRLRMLGRAGAPPLRCPRRPPPAAVLRGRLATLLLLGRTAANPPGSLTLFQVVSIQPSERWVWGIRNSSIWPLKASAMPLTRARACLDPEVLVRNLDRALDHPNQVGARPAPIRRQLAETRPFDATP